MKNNNPFEPWNYPQYRDNPFAPHNEPGRRDNPFEPWNYPFGKSEDLSNEDAEFYGIRRSRDYDYDEER